MMVFLGFELASEEATTHLITGSRVQGEEGLPEEGSKVPLGPLPTCSNSDPVQAHVCSQADPAALGIPSRLLDQVE